MERSALRLGHQASQQAFALKHRARPGPLPAGRRPVVEGGCGPWGEGLGLPIQHSPGVRTGRIPGFYRSWTGEMDDGWIGDGVTLAGGQASGIKAEIREEAK